MHITPRLGQMNESKIYDIGLKIKCGKTRCVPRMLNMFVHKLEQFLQLERKLEQYQLDACDVHWLWLLAAEAFSDEIWTISITIGLDSIYPIHLKCMSSIHLIESDTSSRLLN